MAKVKLITKDVVRKLDSFPLYSQDGKAEDAQVLFKVFNPYGPQSWYILEASAANEAGDRALYGYMTAHGYGEYGYVMLSELENVRVNVFGVKLPLERDRYFSGTIADAKRDAGI